MREKMRKLLAPAVALALAALPLLGPLPSWSATVALTVQQATKAGLSVSRTSTGLSTSDTYQFTNDGKVFILFEKTGAGTATVTITTPGTVSGLAISDQTVTVAATTGDVAVGPLPTAIFNDSSGKVSFTVNDTVGLSIAVISL